jgi:hypothetical protein
MKVVWDHTEILCPYPNQGYITALEPQIQCKNIGYWNKTILAKVTKVQSVFSISSFVCMYLELSMDIFLHLLSIP